MAWVVTSMLTVATTLYLGTKDSSRLYSDIQSYRAGAEMACYQYVTDLQGIILTRDLDGEWISVSGEAVYSEALDTIKATLGTDTDPNTWYVSDLTTALSGANLSDPTILTDLLGKLVGVRQSFSLVVPEPLRLDWDDPESWRDRSGAFVAIEPFKVDVVVTVKGEVVSEEFTVDGLYLNVVATRESVVDGGPKHDIIDINLTEMESGVSITRAQIKETSGLNDG